MPQGEEEIFEGAAVGAFRFKAAGGAEDAGFEEAQDRKSVV